MSKPGRSRTVGGALVALAAGLLIAAGPAAADPIESAGPAPSLPAYQGAPATAQKIKDPTIAPQNPFMAAEPELEHPQRHLDDRRLPAQGPARQLAGRDLGGEAADASAAAWRSTAPAGSSRSARRCSPVPRSGSWTRTRLATLGSLDLPDAANPPGTKPYQNFTGGGYFFLDQKDRIWVPTKTDHISGLQRGRGRRHADARARLRPDLGARLRDRADQLGAARLHGPDLVRLQDERQGRHAGPQDRRARGEEHGRGDRELVRGRRRRHLHRLRQAHVPVQGRAENGRPRVVWKTHYQNSGIVKPSQVDAGSGTTPTIMDNGYVAITDNADPMNVVVYRRAKQAARPEAHGLRDAGLQAGRERDRELADHRRALDDRREQLRLPGPVRARTPARYPAGLRPRRRQEERQGVQEKWTNKDVRAPTVVPKLSTKTGLIYTYERPEDPTAQGYYWTAIDWRNGKTALSQYAGSGLNYNNNYAGIAIGPAAPSTSEWSAGWSHCATRASARNRPGRLAARAPARAAASTTSSRYARTTRGWMPEHARTSGTYRRSGCAGTLGEGETTSRR